MSEEILNNAKSINLYLRHPRKNNRSMSPSNLYPSLSQINHDQPREDKYIQQSLDVGREKFNYQKMKKIKMEKMIQGHKK